MTTKRAPLSASQVRRIVREELAKLRADIRSDTDKVLADVLTEEARAALLNALQEHPYS